MNDEQGVHAPATARADPDDEHREFTPRERSQLRALLERSERSEWLWSAMRAWAIWIAAIVGGVTVSWEILTRIIKEVAR